MLTSTRFKTDKANVAVESRNGTWVEFAISLAVIAAIVVYWIRFLNESDGCMVDICYSGCAASGHFYMLSLTYFIFSLPYLRQQKWANYCKYNDMTHLI
jgi:choline-glycine betaine transporter